MIELNIASVDGEKVKESVESVIIKLVEGNVKILPRHIDFISLIKNGYVKYKDKTIDIEEGVVHFENDRMFITYFK